MLSPSGPTFDESMAVAQGFERPKRGGDENEDPNKRATVDLTGMEAMVERVVGRVVEASNAKHTAPLITAIDGLTGRIGSVESTMQGFTEWQSKQEAVNDELIRRIGALEAGRSVNPASNSTSTNRKVLVKIFGEVGLTDSAIEKAVEGVVGNFSSLGSTVVDHRHPKRNSKAKYTHSLTLEFKGAAEQVHFINKWTAYDAEAKKTTCTLKINGCETHVSEPLPPSLQRMLTELISKKDELVATMGVDGSTLKFDLRNGTIKDAAGELIYASPNGGQGN